MKVVQGVAQAQESLCTYLGNMNVKLAVRVDKDRSVSTLTSHKYYHALLVKFLQTKYKLDDI
ncbi:hypothetical protein [Dysgonomonas sp. BGC7]|uniref:hypothetical protein n=1 Tax=Dysgonomonas sp. BGC7 TaxID=1658008 RepID=UPI000AADEED9|nr:hypothetical protein [Dysgonomonas sp. BGC7]MBD8390380.1 hypothetical protein [Dysgonomonas sp. BGC7]